MLLMILFLSLVLLFLIPIVYALPAALILPRGRRPGLKPLHISQAVEQLQSSGLEGKELAHAARDLVSDRMDYCRRNSFDPYQRAFDRGYGYCQQQAYALVHLLNELDFDARVVHAFRNRLPDGKVACHAWVQFSIDDEFYSLDSIFYDCETGGITFRPISRVMHYTLPFRLIAGWGCVAVNAHRYYVTGRDK